MGILINLLWALVNVVFNVLVSLVANHIGRHIELRTDEKRPPNHR